MLSNKKTRVLAAAGAAVLLLLWLALSLLLNSRAVKPRVEAAASAAAGMDVKIEGRLGVTIYSGLALSVGGIRVSNGGAEVAAIGKMKLGLSLLSLLRRGVYVKRVGLIRPVFTIIRYKNGRYNFEKPAPELTQALLAVKNTYISEGKLVYTDASSGARVEARGVTGGVSNLSYVGKAGGELFREVSFDGDLRCAALLLNKLPLTKVELKAAARNGILDVDLPVMHIYGGTGKGGVHADFTGAAPRYHFTAALRQFQVKQLIETSSLGHIPPDRIEGALDFSTDLTAAGAGAAELKRSLKGTISLGGENLMLHGIDIDALIPKYERSQNFNLIDVGAFFLAGPFGPALTKSYNLGSVYVESRGGKGLLRKLVSVWTVKDGVAEAADVALASKKYRIAMTGGLDFKTDRFLDVKVAVLNKRGCAAYTQKVTGPFNKPSIGKASIFKSLTGPASNALSDVWGLVQNCTVFYSGSVAQPEK